MAQILGPCTHGGASEEAFLASGELSSAIVAGRVDKQVEELPLPLCLSNSGLHV